MLCFGEKVNPFTSPTRNYPVDFIVQNEETYSFTLEIPKGYKVEEIPKSVKHKWEDGTFIYDYLTSVKDNQIKIVSRVIRKRVEFKQEEYKDLREFYNQIVSKMNEQIVLTKISDN